MTKANDTKPDLGVALNITNKWKHSNRAAGAGAGANANSKVDMMTFVGPDKLAELVWSPETGLSIKFADKKPCLMWEVGSSDLGFEDQNATCHESGELAKPSGSVETPRSISLDHTDQKPADPLSQHLFEDGMTGAVDGSGSDTESPLEITQQATHEEHVETSNVKIEKDGCFNNPCHENAQNDILKNKKIAKRDDLFLGEDIERSSFCQENDVESHVSMESCKTKRKLNLIEPQLILGSKRIKKQDPKDGSFMNWISNMMKGVKNQVKYENVTQSVGSFKEMVLADKNCHGSVHDCLEIKEKDSHVNHISLYERVTKEAPKGIFDAIRRLRLSRTDILKWTNTRLSVSQLDGFFVRLRLAKWEEGSKGSRYYVACITGLQGFNQPIGVKVGDVECFVESRYVSNCDFLEDELLAWWQKTLKNGGTLVVKDLKSKLAHRKTLGL